MPRPPWSFVRAAATLVALAHVYGCSGHAPLPPRAAALNQLGLEAFAQGDLATAEARLALALEFHPRFVEALVNLGLVELARGNHERAEALIGRARRLNGDLPHPHHGLGVLAHRRQQLAEAAEHYREALRVDPAFVPSRANLGRLLFDAGAYDEAREQFARLIEAAPGDGRGHAGMVESLVQLGRRADAERALDRGLREAGTTAPVRLLAARAVEADDAQAQAGETEAHGLRLPEILQGEMDELIGALVAEDEAERLASIDG